MDADVADVKERIARSAGLFVGWSTGAAIVAAERLPLAASALVVVIAPDSGDRYLSEQGRLAGERR